jgi:hypothetical protein
MSRNIQGGVHYNTKEPTTQKAGAGSTCNELATGSGNLLATSSTPRPVPQEEDMLYGTGIEYTYRQNSPCTVKPF